jgi:ethanolamine utilization protein EutN
MILARVVGEVVSTHKRPQFDSVGAGRGELVIAVLEGRAAQEALGKKLAPVDAAILGIVDHVDVHE